MSDLAIYRTPSARSPAILRRLLHTAAQKFQTQSPDAFASSFDAELSDLDSIPRLFSKEFVPTEFSVDATINRTEAAWTKFQNVLKRGATLCRAGGELWATADYQNIAAEKRLGRDVFRVEMKAASHSVATRIELMSPLALPMEFTIAEAAAVRRSLASSAEVELSDPPGSIFYNVTGKSAAAKLKTVSVEQTNVTADLGSESSGEVARRVEKVLSSHSRGGLSDVNFGWLFSLEEGEPNALATYDALLKARLPADSYTLTFKGDVTGWAALPKIRQLCNELGSISVFFDRFVLEVPQPRTAPVNEPVELAITMDDEGYSLEITVENTQCIEILNEQLGLELDPDDYIQG